MVISSKDAQKMLQETEHKLILDVRTKEEFESGYIDGAVNVPYEDIPLQIENITTDKTLPIFLYCRSGARVKVAVEMLTLMGYTTLYDFGGIMDWEGEIKPYDGN